MSNKSFTTNALQFLLPALVIISTLLFLPLTPNIFETPKQFTAILSLVILFTTYLAHVVVYKELIIPRSRLLTPGLIFVALIVLNVLLYPENRAETLYGIGSLYIVVTLLAIAASFVSDNAKTRHNTLIAFVVSTSALALHSLIQLIFLYKITALPLYMQSRMFTPTGSALTTLTLLVIGSVTTYIMAAKLTRGVTQYLALVAGIIQTIAAVAYIALLLPGGTAVITILPHSASWALTLDALKSVKTCLFGVGLSNFPVLFNSFKPLALNTTNFWNITPASASSHVLQLLATTGITGLVAFASFGVASFVKAHTTSALDLIYHTIVGLIFLSFVITPASVPLLLIFAIALGLATPSTQNTVKLTGSAHYLIAVIGILVTIVVSYFCLRYLLAEFYIGRAQRALSVSDGKAVYESNLKAINLVPSLSNYHLAYSQVNLSLASALSQKSDLTEEERNQVATLISQSINEGKQAVALRPSDAKMWRNLGAIYRNLINVAQGADQFAVSSLQKAIALDAGNPELRVEYAGLLFQLAGGAQETEAKNNLLAQSITQFQTAVQLKPDYANAYYNLSKALESTGNITAAYNAMQKALASLSPNSPDLERATKDLEALKAKLPQASPSSTNSTATASGELAEPSPLPSPIEGGPIDLPLESPTP